jgi:hypothetical protein
MIKYKKRTALLVSLFLLAMLVASATPSAAEEKYTGPALEWEIVDTIPTKVETGERFQVIIKFTNEGTVDLTGGNKTTVELSIGGDPLDTDIIILAKNKSQTVTYSITINRDGTHQLELNSYFRYGIVNLWRDDGIKTRILGDLRAETVEEPFNWLPIIIIIIVAGAGVGIYYFMSEKKKKAEEEQRLADEARRQEMIRKKEEEIAKKIAVRQVVGKHPKDYYVLRRTKYANLRPAGMTSSGLNILRKALSKAELEAQRISCPTCGTDLKEVGAECPRCTATEKIEAVRHSIRTYKSRADADFTDADALLRKAEHRLNWSDFSMAIDLVTQAEVRMEEIWEASEKGEAIESRVQEYSEADGPSLDSKLIGLEGEETMAPSVLAAASETAPVREEPTGEACPDCGNPMDNDECLFCNFNDNLDGTWAIIEMGEMDGADMNEVKDLCRQANSAKERDNDDMAIRLLRRANRMAEEVYHSHGRSKTEGIIGFTNTLIMQVKSMGEDVAMAEQMIGKASDAMEAGEYEDARSLAAKADGYLKQMREDSYRKRISELMPGVEAGAATNPEVQTLLGKAKKLIDANELEGAADILEAASSKL